MHALGAFPALLTRGFGPEVRGGNSQQAWVGPIGGVSRYTKRKLTVITTSLTSTDT